MMRSALAVLAVLCSVDIAFAHEWYGKRRDPIFSSTTCCGGADCAVLPAHTMQVTPDGLMVTLTADEANKINPNRFEPFQKLIEFDRIQVSEDGKPHICLQPTQNDFDKRQGYYCIFLPANG